MALVAKKKTEQKYNYISKIYNKETDEKKIKLTKRSKGKGIVIEDTNELSKNDKVNFVAILLTLTTLSSMGYVISRFL